MWDAVSELQFDPQTTSGIVFLVNHSHDTASYDWLSGRKVGKNLSHTCAQYKGHILTTARVHFREACGVMTITKLKNGAALNY